ncbi:MAG: putative acyltransferase [Daejeonella sp.]|nr:putative acyltransferase [Daejeonella sp.]
MFFVLSGFIICWSIPDDFNLAGRGKFMLKRILRIEPAYIISLILLLSLNAITIRHYKVDWFNVLFHLFYLNNYFDKPFLNPVYWTLGIEFQFYLLVALFFPLFNKAWSKWTVLLISCLPIVIPITGLSLLNFFPLFGLGMLCYMYLKGLIFKKDIWMFAIMISTVSYYSLGWVQASVGLSAFIILFIPIKSNKLIKFLAKISFSLYLVHDIIGSRLVVYLGTVFPRSLLVKGLIFSTGIGVSLLSAYVFYLLVEKPFIKLSKRVVYARATNLIIMKVNKSYFIPPNENSSYR